MSSTSSDKNQRCKSPVLQKGKSISKRRRRKFFPRVPTVLKDVICKTSIAEFSLPIEYFKYIKLELPAKQSKAGLENGSICLINSSPNICHLAKADCIKDERETTSNGCDNRSDSGVENNEDSRTNSQHFVDNVHAHNPTQNTSTNVIIGTPFLKPVDKVNILNDCRRLNLKSSDTRNFCKRDPLTSIDDDNEAEECLNASIITATPFMNLHKSASRSTKRKRVDVQRDSNRTASATSRVDMPSVPASLQNNATDQVSTNSTSARHQAHDGQDEMTNTKLSKPSVTVSQSSSSINDVIAATPFIKLTKNILRKTDHNKCKVIDIRKCTSENTVSSNAKSDMTGPPDSDTARDNVTSVKLSTASRSVLTSDVITGTPFLKPMKNHLLHKPQVCDTSTSMISTKSSETISVLKEDGSNCTVINCNEFTNGKSSSTAVLDAANLVHPSRTETGPCQIDHADLDSKGLDKETYNDFIITATPNVCSTLVDKYDHSADDRDLHTETASEKSEGLISDMAISTPLSTAKGKTGISEKIDGDNSNQTHNVSQITVMLLIDDWFCAVLINNEEVLIFVYEHNCSWSRSTSWTTITQINDIYFLSPDWANPVPFLNVLQLNKNTADVYLTVVDLKSHVRKQVFLKERIDVLTSACTLCEFQFVLCTTEVAKYTVNTHEVSLEKILTLASVDETIMSLSSVGKEQNAIIGSSIQSIYIWNHCNGLLLQKIYLCNINVSNILSSFVSNGIVICHCILSTNIHVTRSCTILAVNPLNGNHYVFESVHGIHKNFLLRVCTAKTNSIIFHDDISITDILKQVGVPVMHVPQETCSLLRLLPRNGSLFALS